MKNFALAGNPNCGKTTLFNALTGSTAHVGNWPGVTVDKREGVYKKRANIVDLPGIYSLSPYTPEEVIARNYILNDKPDGIINVVDVTNLERNLYLTTQLLEMDVPVIVALNMCDMLGNSFVDESALEKALGVPVVKVSALKEYGIDALMERALKMPSKRNGSSIVGGVLGKTLQKAVAYYRDKKVSSPLFHAVKLLEKDELELTNHSEMLTELALTDSRDFESLIADWRYKYISENFSVTLRKSTKSGLTKSDKVDKVLTHRVWGIPLFLVILFAVFHFTFSEDLLFLGAIFKLPSIEESGLSDTAGGTLLGLVYDGAVYSPGVILTNLLTLLLDSVNEWVSLGLSAVNAQPWLISFISEGILGGIFAVLGFLPQILMLFLFFSILEDSGYMARVAFILDRIFRKFGLSGRAFMPMIMGFGCSLPAMINTRTLADERERTATIRVIPMFSCGAKLPILTAIAGGIVEVFHVGNADLITYSMYLTGIICAIVCVVFMRNTTMRGDVPPFIMELPTYHAPKFKALMIHLWDKCKHFVKKAFTIIFASTVLIWFLSSFDFSWNFLINEEGENLVMDKSILGGLGKLIQPLFTPLGFGSQLGTKFGWVFAVAAITGLVAKENVISTFGTLAACIIGFVVQTEDGVKEAVTMIEGTGITIPALIAFIVFNMTTIPCFAACATAKAELPEGKFKWTLLFWVVASYIASCAVYTVGTAWWTVFIWIAVTAVATALIIMYNKGIFKCRKNNNR